EFDRLNLRNRYLRQRLVVEQIGVALKHTAEFISSTQILNEDLHIVLLPDLNTRDRVIGARRQSPDDELNLRRRTLGVEVIDDLERVDRRNIAVIVDVIKDRLGGRLAFAPRRAL